MSADTDWSAWLAGLRQRLRPAGERRLLWLQGAPNWGRLLARNAALNAGAVLWIGAGGPPDARCLGCGDARRALGDEFESVVFDAAEGFCPDAFGAVAGTLRGGGLLLLLTPPDWPGGDDPWVADHLSWPHAPAAFGRRYLGRLRRRLDDCAAVLQVTEGATLPALPEVVGTAWSSAPQSDGCATNDQRRAVDAVCRVATGHPRRPLLLAADRGRGKSAALGIAAARLLAARPDQRILVTAPHRAAVATLFAHAGQATGDAAVVRRLRFVGAAELGSLARPGDLVLVDEAAGLPVPRLEQWLTQCSRIVFATTQHGYEGAGRGFTVRFIERLDALRPQRRLLRLEQPIRWRDGDPLERWLNGALLLDAELPETGGPDFVTDSVRIEPVAHEDLAADEPLLRAMVALLVAAHYQTRPHDLRLLLDAPDTRLWIARHDDAVLGVAWVGIEGGFDAGMTACIAEGRRRPHGHLLPQTLAYHLGASDATPLRYARVNRIVVDPALRRRGIGRRLLTTVVAWAEADGLDLVGSSFGVTPGLLAFWRAAGFAPVRVGDRADQASGERSVVLLKPLRQAADALCRHLSRRFIDELPWALRDANRLRDLEPALIVALLSGSGVADTPTDADRGRLRAFAAGRLPLTDCLPELRRAWLAQLAGRGTPDLAESDRDLATRVLLQGQAIETAAKCVGMTGRTAALVRLRNLKLDWISVQS